KKLEKFNEEAELRDMYYKRDLNRAANKSEKQEIYEKGKAEGKVDLIEARYGIREEEWVLSLNIKQLKTIDKIIFKEEEYQMFKQLIEKISE
ncbi:hypothetical protein, partial [Thomasclavelia cocleata]|uniref:hypothetical protein n=1 Tax=Thomasclavelia cocleata TaxID=69824 RepID=UPI00242EC824